MIKKDKDGKRDLLKGQNVDEIGGGYPNKEDMKKMIKYMDMNQLKMLLLGIIQKKNH